MRRRLMLKKHASADVWDYEWNPSMGLLSQNGFTIVSDGIASESMGANGVILNSDRDGYISARNPETFNKTRGVIEAIVNLTGNVLRAQNCRVCFGNGTFGIQISIGARDSICLMDAESATSYTIIAPFQINTDYKIMLVLDNNIADVYVNEQLIRSNIAVSAELFNYSANTAIWSQGQNASTIIKSVRFKLGRV